MTSIKFFRKIAGRALLNWVLLVLCIVHYSTIFAINASFEYLTDEETYQYTVVQTGDNFNFKFEKKLEGDLLRLKAGYHILQSIYEDTSINKTHSESYIRERARCYVFDSNFHTYSMCFLPNEFSKNKQDRLRGFVTQVPNWKWQFTRVLLPVSLVFAIVFFAASRKNSESLLQWLSGYKGSGNK